MKSDLLKKALIRTCYMSRDIYEMSTATTTTTTINEQGFPQRSLPDFHMEVLENGCIARDLYVISLFLCVCGGVGGRWCRKYL